MVKHCLFCFLCFALGCSRSLLSRSLHTRFGRENFQEAMKVVQRAEAIDWHQFKFMVFDLPKHGGSYAERYHSLGKTNPSFFFSYRLPGVNCWSEEALGHRPWRFIEIAPMQSCLGIAHLEEIFQDVVDKGGEGVILRDPKSPYQEGRSLGYLKHKVWKLVTVR